MAKKKYSFGLFGSRYKDNNEFTRLTIEALGRFQGFEKIVEVYEFSCFFLQGGWDEGYAIFALSDNGGEVQVMKINHQDIDVGVAATSNRCALTPATMAYRIAKTVKGQYNEIDWDYNETDERYFGQYAKQFWPSK